jgi:hypothetical protein
MVQFKNIFADLVKRAYASTVSAQKCVRAGRHSHGGCRIYSCPAVLKPRHPIMEMARQAYRILSAVAGGTRLRNSSTRTRVFSE